MTSYVVPRTAWNRSGVKHEGLRQVIAREGYLLPTTHYPQRDGEEADDQIDATREYQWKLQELNQNRDSKFAPADSNESGPNPSERARHRAAMTSCRGDLGVASPVVFIKRSIMPGAAPLPRRSLALVGGKSGIQMSIDC